MTHARATKTHPVILLLKMTFFLWVLYMFCKLAISISGLLFGSVVLVSWWFLCSLVPSLRGRRKDAVENMRRLGFWAMRWNPMLGKP